MKIKKGDNVKVISGNDRGRIAKVISVIPAKDKLIVEGINMRKKHLRPREQGKKGEMVKVPLAIKSSRVLVVCPHCSKATRLKYKLEGVKKERSCRACQKAI